MIELPESYTLGRQLQKEIQGKDIESSRFHTWPHKFAFYHDDYMLYSPLLKNKRVDAVRQLGGNVELELGELRLILGDGLRLSYLRPDQKLPEKHQLHMQFSDGSSLIGSTQMYSVINLFHDGDVTTHYYTNARDFPNPLTDAFDRDYFMDMLHKAKQNLSTKAFLATEQRIPGLGNGVLQDILFRAGIHHQTKISQLDEELCDRLFDSVKNTLREMADQGGRDTEKDIYGNAGGYKTILSKKTIKEPCPECGHWISRKAYLGGNIYYCEKCQPIL